MDLLGGTMKEEEAVDLSIGLYVTFLVAVIAFMTAGWLLQW